MRTVTARFLTRAAIIALALQPLGCAETVSRLTPRQRAIEDVARPLLALDPDVEWTARYNRLAEFGDEAIAYLIAQPPMQQRAAPDDLDTLLHTSLIRLLSGHAAPALTVNCFETTLELLHFDPRVDGQPLGEICIPAETRPRVWHDVYPHRVAQHLADRIDAEADRNRIINWWRTGGAPARAAAGGNTLQPKFEDILPLLSRRYADCWVYETDRKAILVAAGAPQLAPGSALMQVETRDYNLVRAACIWLGTRPEDVLQQRLIELVADDNPIIVHNALFALRFSRDPRIRGAIQRYNSGGQGGP